MALFGEFAMAVVGIAVEASNGGVGELCEGRQTKKKLGFAGALKLGGRASGSVLRREVLFCSGLNQPRLFLQ